MRKNVAWALLAALSLTACENNESDNWNGEIRLGSSVNSLSVTKAFGLDTQIKVGQEVSLWVDDTKTSQELYQNNFLTVRADGALTSATTMFFPQTGNGVDLYAIHPYTATSAFPTADAPYVHTVNADQTSAEAYAASDLLYAVKKGQERTSNTINLSFNHILSKVEVKLTAGAGAPSLEGATVELDDLVLGAEFRPAKDADLAQSTIAARSGEAPESITIGNSTSEANEAIVVPQKWEANEAGNKALIKITLKDGGVLRYVPTADITFDSGKKYVYNITANLTGLTVSAKIADWGKNTEVEGSATMQ